MTLWDESLFAFSSCAPFALTPIRDQLDLNYSSSASSASKLEAELGVGPLQEKVACAREDICK